LREADSYDVIPKLALQQMFLPIPDGPIPQQAPLTSALKPDVAPSDMAIEESITPTQSEDPQSEEGR
jgi:hypothetical protein